MQEYQFADFRKCRKLLQVSGSSLSLLFPLLPELEKVDADLSSLTPEQRLQLSEFVTKSDARLQALKRSIADRAWTELTDSSASPESMLKDVVANLDGRAKTEESAMILKHAKSCRRS